MSSSGHFTLLASDFQALASETKRKHADIKEACDKALALIKASPDQVLASLRMPGVLIPSTADDIFRPIFMTRVTKNAKLVAIALGSLQRLIAMDAVSSSKIHPIVNLLSSVLPLGVEIQLRILQTLPSLFTRCAQYLHGDLLAEALLLCFRLQDSRISVVSSTAAATLRQLVMVVFEGVTGEDKAVTIPPEFSSEPDLTRAETGFIVKIPPFEGIHLSGEVERIEARQINLRPSAKDAYLVFEDLCLLVNGDSPSFLKLQSLPKTFGLELIESVMTGHGYLFQQHPELIFVLKSQLCPLLIRALSDKPTFPLTLRLMRVAFLLLKQFSDNLLVEAEIFLSLIVKTISIEQLEGHAEPVPTWLRVLALEIFRGLCVDFDLLQRIYERYDMPRGDHTTGLFTSMMGMFNRLASERPALLGINQDISTGSSSYQVGFSANPSVQGMIDGVVGMASQAAAPLVGVQQGGLSLATAAMKLQCIDQLDKAEAPIIPDTYVYFLALQCICNVAEGFAGFTLTQHEAFRNSKPSNPSDGTAPSTIIPIDELKPGSFREPLQMTRSMANASWPALLASLNFFVSTNLDDELFTQTLSAMKSFTYVCGILDLTTPRDAFLLSFCKFSVPPAILANMNPEASGVSSTNDSLGLGAAASTHFSSRSLSFLNTLMSVAQYLAGILGNSWYTIFETLQNADYLLAARQKKRSTLPNTLSSAASSNSSDESVIQANIQKLFECSCMLDSDAFTSFVNSLCRLSSETIGLATESDTCSTAVNAPRALTLDIRRKVSGAHVLRISRQNEPSFAVAKLGTVAVLNIRRLVLSDSQIAWVPITSHLLAVQRYPEAPSSIRLQAADALDRIILSTPKLINNLEEPLQCRIQTQVMEVLGRQAGPNPREQSSTDTEVRKLGFETLYKILENNGHSFVAGWKLIFDVLRTACEPAKTTHTLPIQATPKAKGSLNSSGNTTSKLSILVRNSFPSLQLICTDFLTALNLEELHQCISVLAEFGRQVDDINIALTSGGLLWQVSDHVQGKNKVTGESRDSYVRLWMYLLSQLLKLVEASRQEIRDGAIQTLFRTIGLYGNSLSSSIWQELMWDVIFPLLNVLTDLIKETPSESSSQSIDENVPVDVSRQPNGVPINLAAKQLDDSKILALESTGKVVSDHLASHILIMPRFLETWDTLIHHLCGSFTSGRPSVCTASMKTLGTILNSNLTGDHSTEKLHTAWQVAWDSFVQMGEAVRASPSGPNSRSTYFTQSALEAYIQVIRPLQNKSRLEMNRERVNSLLDICLTTVKYSKSPDYRSDIDHLPPVHAAVVESIDHIDLDTPGVPSAILSSLSELSLLAFNSPFDVADPFSNRSASIRVTYISLFKALQPKLINLTENFCNQPEVYNDGAITKVLSSISLPLKLKYRCPPSSKYGQAPPLWKTASLSFLSIIKCCLKSLTSLKSNVLQVAFESFWKQLVENFSCALLADCKSELLVDLVTQRAEENFDLAFLASLELDVLPCLGQSRIPDEIIQALGNTVQAATRLYDFDVEVGSALHPMSRTNDNPDSYSVPPGNCRFDANFALQAKQTFCGTTAGVTRRPRERFIFWCFDLLFLFCSRSSSEKSLEDEYRRVASIWLPILLARCIAAIRAYTVDAPIRGTVPFDRLRGEEIMYILQQSLTHSVWDGCLTASIAGAGFPQPFKLDVASPPEKTLPVTLKQSSYAHLLCLQALLIDLLACESSTQLGSLNNGNFCSHGASIGLGPISFTPYRDLTQILNQNGSDVEGCWKDLKLGRIGRQRSHNQSDLFNKDLKQLILMCLRAISEQTTLHFNL